MFGFTDAQLKKDSSVCMAKETFQINKAIDFDKLLNIVEKLANVMKKKPKFVLNKVEHLSRRKKQNQKLTDKLDLWARDLPYNNCVKDEDSDVDFCHSKFDSYLSADSINLQIEGGEPIELKKHCSFDDVVRALKSTGDCFTDDQEHFNASVLNRIIISTDSEGHVLTKGSVFDHVHGEFFHNDKTYFLLDNEWYYIKSTFIRDLNIECSELINHSWDTTTLPEPFDLTKRESVYNQKYIHKPNYFVFDTITPDNVESCDIMEYGENAVKLIHVKKGFDNSLRDLTSQINIAAKRVRDDLRTGFGYIENVQNKASKSKVGQLGKQKYPAGGLASIFKGKSPQQITFCLAFADKSVTNRNLKEQIHLFNSNIAKFSLLELKKELYSMGLGFKVIQLTKG